MKNAIKLMILAAAMITTTIKAQDMRTDFSMGLKGGFNLANVYDSEGEKFIADSKFGFVGGVFLSIPIGKFIGIQPEILFSQKGFKGTGAMLGTPYSISRTTSYIDLPVLFSLKPSPFVTLMVGPQYSYLLRQKDQFTSTFSNDAQEQEFENDDVRRNILCFLGGIDFNFSHVVVGTRMGWDIHNNNGDGTSTTPRYKNTWLQATLGFRL
jgi:hypothetical protein